MFGEFVVFPDPDLSLESVEDVSSTADETRSIKSITHLCVSLALIIAVDPALTLSLAAAPLSSLMASKIRSNSLLY